MILLISMFQVAKHVNIIQFKPFLLNYYHCIFKRTINVYRIVYSVMMSRMCRMQDDIL